MRLIRAVKKHNIYKIKKLLNNGVDADKQNNRGDTALMYSSREDIIELLMSRRNCVKEIGDTMRKHEELQTALEDIRANMKTDSYQMSIADIIDIYQSGEMNIGKRGFGWDNEQRSKFIKSILIGYPLDSIRIIQDSNGHWEAAKDQGAIKLFTIFDFLGILKKKVKMEKNYNRFEKLDEDSVYLKEFSNKGWNDFPISIKLDFKRTKIQLNIIKFASKFDFFEYTPD